MVVFGFVIEFYWQCASRKIAMGFSIVLAIALVANALGSMEKTRAMAEEFNRAQILMAQIYPIISALPLNGNLYLVNPSPMNSEYWVFAMKGFGPVKYADPWILRHTARPDVKLFVVDSSQLRDSILVHPGVAYTIDMRTLHIEPY